MIAFGSVILDAQSQGAGRHQWDVNVIDAVKVAKASTKILKGSLVKSKGLCKVSHLDLKRRLDHLRAHHRNRKACHSFTIQKDLRRPQAELCLLRRPCTHLDQSTLLHHRNIFGNIRVHATGEDLESSSPRSLHWHREQLHRHRSVERTF